MEPFQVDVPNEVLGDLQERLQVTGWADDFANESWQYDSNTGGVPIHFVYVRGKGPKPKPLIDRLELIGILRGVP